ncbi:hypothetical protein AX17_002277 [Amanita inopinata Kibby_2008]|nr:hypothetical protein AX17_002277 [Amanita inopinata Kibby_2008]
MSIFSINPNDPGDVNLLSKPVGSGGEFPMSAIINKAGTKACVLNGGEINTVACFKIDSVRGLIPISRSVRPLKMPQTTPAYGVPGSASQIVFTEDEKRLVALVKGSNTLDGFTAVFDINADDSLSAEPRIMNIGKNVYPFSLTTIPGTNSFISGDPAAGYDIINLDALDNKSVKPLTPFVVPGQKGVCWSVQSPKTGNYYLTDTETGKIIEVSVGRDLKPTTVAQHYTDAYDVLLDADVAHTPQKDFLYALAANATSVDVLDLRAPGKARLIQKYDLSCPASKVGIPVEKLYVQGLAVYVKKNL